MSSTSSRKSRLSPGLRALMAPPRSGRVRPITPVSPLAPRLLTVVARLTAVTNGDEAADDADVRGPVRADGDGRPVVVEPLAGPRQHLVDGLARVDVHRREVPRVDQVLARVLRVQVQQPGRDGDLR